MNVMVLEQWMYQLSSWFMAPVLIAIAALFLYSLYATGQFAAQWWQRRNSHLAYLQALKGDRVSPAQVTGFSLLAFALRRRDVTMDELDLMALKDLEALRIITRIAPMLGLIATMIPMAPALKALGDGNVQGISENLIVAFSAVIFGMVIASLTFWLASIKKRWLAVELVDIVRLKKIQTKDSEQAAANQKEVMLEAA
jgi:biopolymer transport protein ExbB/TolQ